MKTIATVASPEGRLAAPCYRECWRQIETFLHAAGRRYFLAAEVDAVLPPSNRGFASMFLRELQRQEAVIGQEALFPSGAITVWYAPRAIEISAG